MELNQLETFLAVISFGGFHRAAGALRVSQPAVSARIKALEDSLGVTVFDAWVPISNCRPPVRPCDRTPSSSCAKWPWRAKRCTNSSPPPEARCASPLPCPSALISCRTS